MWAQRRLKILFTLDLGAVGQLDAIIFLQFHHYIHKEQQEKSLNSYYQKRKSLNTRIIRPISSGPNLHNPPETKH